MKGKDFERAKRTVSVKEAKTRWFFNCSLVIAAYEIVLYSTTSKTTAITAAEVDAQLGLGSVYFLFHQSSFLFYFFFKEKNDKDMAQSSFLKNVWRKMVVTIFFFLNNNSRIEK